MTAGIAKNLGGAPRATEWRGGLAGGSALAVRRFDFALPTAPGVEPRVAPEGVASAKPRRRRIWEMEPHLHCSIIGTCLTAAELRSLLARLKTPGIAGATDHELHSQAVALAGRHDVAGKMLNKLLDRRHQAAIARFDNIATMPDLRQRWQEHLEQGDIPGAYWAALTHPCIDLGLARRIFGEVHMLSHLVGAANRADIRRLRQLELDNAVLRDRLDRQRQQQREALADRDRRIAALDIALANVPAATVAAPAAAPDLAAALAGELASEQRRRGRAEQALAQARAELAAAIGERQAAEERLRLLGAELEAMSAAMEEGEGSAPVDAPIALQGRTILYVGGRRSAMPRLRAWIERHGGALLHHDGGIDEREGLLAGLVSRADLVVFPVDCVSHRAVDAIKRYSALNKKNYRALRTTGLGALIIALQRDLEGLGGPDRAPATAAD